MKLKPFLLLLAIGISFNACKEDDPIPELPVELITTLIMKFTPITSGNELTFTFQDTDGDGGNAPIITSEGNLSASTSYTVAIELLNESITPTEDITEEIAGTEATEHQFFFQGTDGLELSFAYADEDENGKPICLETLMTTGNPSTGTLRVTLRHRVDKEAVGVQFGDITNAGGETDIEADFDITIE